MVPSTYEDGTLYNVLPSGNKAPDETGNHNGYDQTRADFTFSRGSNLAATRVNANGLIEKGRENLLLQSNQFDTTWSAILGASVTSGQSGYDGSSDAWRLTKASGQSSRIYQDITLSTILHTTSIYAKADTLQYLAILEFSGSVVYFDLTNGTIGTTSGSPIDVKIEAVGATGWYRCSITDDNAITQLRIYATDTDGSISGSGSIYIQDAQVENSLVATPYIETGSVSATAGVLENTPRIDYSSGAGALLLEPQRTNLLAQSEYYNTYYTRDGVSVSDNALTSPEGLQNASKLVEDSANSKHRIGKATFPSGTQRTLSVFAKAGERNYISLFENNAVGNDVKGAIFNLSNGTLSINNSPSYYSNPTIEPIGSNGWYRCSVTWTPTSLSVPSFGVSADGLENTYQGDGTSGIYIWGGMLEEASHVSSYVPTYGSAATRGADSLYKQNINSILGSEGTLYLEIEPYDVSTSTSVFKKILGLFKTNGSVADAIYLEEYIGNWGVWVRKGNSTITSTGYKTTQPTKVAVTFGTGGSKIYFDGVQQAITSTDTSNAMNQISTQSNAGAGIESVLQLKELVYFNEVLSDSELATLTTL